VNKKNAAIVGGVKLESTLESLKEFQRGDMLQRNIRSCERGFREVKVVKWL
jgi:hypothetical protein